MSSWAKPGVKCQCVDATEHPEITVGAIYTVVKATPPDRFLLTAGKFASSSLWVYLAEADNRIGSLKCFAVERFRPLITKTQEQDVALFQHILDGLPVGESA